MSTRRHARQAAPCAYRRQQAERRCMAEPALEIRIIDLTQLKTCRNNESPPPKVIERGDEPGLPVVPGAPGVPSLM